MDQVLLGQGELPAVGVPEDAELRGARIFLGSSGGPQELDHLWGPYGPALGLVLGDQAQHILEPVVIRLDRGVVAMDLADGWFVGGRSLVLVVIVRRQDAVGIGRSEVRRRAQRPSVGVAFVGRRRDTGLPQCVGGGDRRIEAHGTGRGQGLPQGHRPRDRICPFQGLAIKKRVIQEVRRIPIGDRKGTLGHQNQAVFVHAVVGPVIARPIDADSPFLPAALRRGRGDDESAVDGYFAQIVLPVVVLAVNQGAAELGVLRPIPPEDGTGAERGIKGPDWSGV